MDIKVTSARQKIYGLGYSLLVFVYDKRDDPATKTGKLDILQAIFVEKARTADHQTTSGLPRLIENKANRDDILAFFEDLYMPFEETAAVRLAERVLRHPPVEGVLGKLSREEMASEE